MEKRQVVDFLPLNGISFMTIPMTGSGFANLLRKIRHTRILIYIFCGIGLFVMLSYMVLPNVFKVLCYAGLILFVLALVFVSEFL